LYKAVSSQSLNNNSRKKILPSFTLSTDFLPLCLCELQFAPTPCKYKSPYATPLMMLNLCAQIRIALRSSKRYFSKLPFSKSASVGAMGLTGCEHYMLRPSNNQLFPFLLIFLKQKLFILSRASCRLNKSNS
jgi:hypothetical protein